MLSHSVLKICIAKLAVNDDHTLSLTFTYRFTYGDRICMSALMFAHFVPALDQIYDGDMAMSVNVFTIS